MRHRLTRLSLLVVFVTLALGLASSAFAQQQPPEGQTSLVEVPPEGFVPGEVLVKFKSGTSEAQKKEAHRRKGGQRKEVIPRIEVEEVQVPQGQEESRAADYENDSNVEYAELNGIYKALDTDQKEVTEPPPTSSDPTASMTPSDPRVGKQWAYHNSGAHDWKKDADIDAFKAWDHTTGSSAVPIAILDTGIDQSHEDLEGKVAKSVDCTTKGVDCDPNVSAEDKYGHGTHVAGTAAADTNNATGVAGTCPDCTLYNVKVLGDDGTGTFSSVAEGIRWSADNEAKVINMSLGGSRSSTIKDAVNYAWENGVVLAAAAGNDGTKSHTYPAAYDKVIAVGASNYYDKKAGFSNYGGWVDVAAPGVGILSTTRDGKYGTMSGTSMATPHVAGLAGLVWSTSYGTDNGSVRTRIESTTDRIRGTGTNWSNGRINACKAVGGSCRYRR